MLIVHLERFPWAYRRHQIQMMLYRTGVEWHFGCFYFLRGNCTLLNGFIVTVGKLHARM